MSFRSHFRFLVLGYAALAGLLVLGCEQRTGSEMEGAASSMQSGHGSSQKSWPPLQDGAAATASNLAASNYYVVLDGSGSMSSSDCAPGSQKIAVAQSALQRFTRSLPDDANLGLAAFDGGDVSERLSLGVNNRPEFATAVSSVRANGSTPLRAAIALGYQKLTEQAQRQLGYGEYHLVVVTDGDSTDGDPARVVNTLLASSPVILHTIGFCIGTDHALNQAGRVYYLSADSPAQLEQGLSTVLAEAPAFDATSFTQ